MCVEKMASLLSLLLTTFLIIQSNCHRTPPLPPLPLPPLPTSSHLKWQTSEMSLFFHFGTNTFTDSEWGTGHTPPTVFSPKNISALQWAQVAKSNGFSRVILTAKHHDGFCLWPSEYTEYSVRSSGYGGDVVGELAAASRELGMEVGVYLSPWDRHEKKYGKTLEYNQFYLGQMTELLTNYGEIKEVWLDGAKGEGEKDMEYFFDTWFEVIHQLQPNSVIFSDAGPDIRWVGDETGVAGTTCWSLFNQSDVTIGQAFGDYNQNGDQYGRNWVPAECDVSIRPGWFWHDSEHPKSALTLLDIYYKSVGRNCLLLLNVPPNSSGLISEEDIQVLQEFATLRNKIFSHNLAQDAAVNASSTRGGSMYPNYAPANVFQDGIYTYWAPEETESNRELLLDLNKLTQFNVIQIQEPIQMGQRVIAFHIDVLQNGGWRRLIDGTTIGYKRLVQFSMVEAQLVRFVVDKSRDVPLIAHIGLYLDSYSTAYDVYNASIHNSFSHQRYIEMTRMEHSANRNLI